MRKRPVRRAVALHRDLRGESGRGTASVGHEYVEWAPQFRGRLFDEGGRTVGGRHICHQPDRPRARGDLSE